MGKKVAVLLNGCGHRDGSEIHEAVFTLAALDELSIPYQCMSLDLVQNQIINHYTGKPVEGLLRNMLEESARIARGNIVDLKKVSAQDYAALLIPGGIGSASNLCNYASNGRDMEVLSEVSEWITSFFAAKKPIGAICIAPVLVAKVLGKHGVLVTSGNDEHVANDIVSWGARHEVCSRGECIVDSKNRIVSTPAYMYGDSSLTDVFCGIKSLVKEIKKFL